MKLTNNHITSVISIVFGLALVSGVFGNACGGGFNSAINGDGLSLQSFGNSDLIPIEGKITVGTAYSKQFLDNLVSCTGVQPSTETLLEYENRKGSVSEFGYATKITAPMLMAFVGVAGEVCADLLNSDRGIADAQAATGRHIFNSFEFDNNNTIVADGQVTDAVYRLARSCWQRDPSNEEITFILNDVFRDGTPTPDEAALMLCTSMLASVSSYEM